MKKYLYIFKSEIMSNLQYAFDILIGFIGYAVHIFIFLNLWEYIYSDPNLTEELVKMFVLVIFLIILINHITMLNICYQVI